MNQTTGILQSRIQSNKDIEIQYFIVSINKQNKIESTIPNNKLTVSDKVRFIEHCKALNKTRYDVTPYY
jgi:hypothetical protein